MSECGKCLQVCDYMIDSIMCHGNCHKTFHVNCIGATYSAIKLLNKCKSFYFFCDECNPFDEYNIVRNVLSNTKMIEKLEKHVSFLNEKIDNISNNPILNRKKTRSVTNNEKSVNALLDIQSQKRKSDDLDMTLIPPVSSKRINLNSISENSFQQIPNNVTENPPTSTSASSSQSPTASSQPPTALSEHAPDNATEDPAMSTSASSSQSPTASSLLPAALSEQSSHSAFPYLNTHTSTTSSTQTITSSMLMDYHTNSLPAPSATNTVTSHHAASLNDRNFISPIESGLRIVDGQRTIFISKLEPSTNALDVKNFIMSKIGTLRSTTVEKMLHRNYSKYSSFKIKVPDSMFHLLNSKSFWPNGIIVHEFQNRKQIKQSHPFPQRMTMPFLTQSSYTNY